MRCELRFKPAVQATECVSRFRVFLTDHICGQLVILNKPHMRIVAPAVSENSRMHYESGLKILLVRTSIPLRSNQTNGRTIERSR